MFASSLPPQWTIAAGRLKHIPHACGEQSVKRTSSHDEYYAKSFWFSGGLAQGRS